jgi:hypothetical protein
MSEINKVSYLENNSWLRPTTGELPSLTRKIISIFNTAIDYLAGLLYQNDVVGNLGKELNFTELSSYFNYLAKEYTEFHWIGSFAGTDFLGKQNEIDNIKKGIANFQKDPDQSKLAIPLVLRSGESFGRKHNVLLFIDKKNSTIEYFDPKGVSSEHIHLENDRKLSEIIKELAQAEGLEGYQLKEHKAVLQLDCHSCGAFVSLFVTGLLDRGSSDFMTELGESDAFFDIRDFRRYMFKKIKDSEEQPDIQDKEASLIEIDDKEFSEDFDRFEVQFCEKNEIECDQTFLALPFVLNTLERIKEAARNLDKQQDPKEQEYLLELTNILRETSQNHFRKKNI